MGIGLHCLIEPDVASDDEAFTDGKNLAEVYMADAVGDAGAPSGGGIFDPLTPFIGGALSGGSIKWHDPQQGLEAFAETIRRLREPATIEILHDSELRDGCIHDLEQFTKMVQEAKTHGALFSLVFDV